MEEKFTKEELFKLLKQYNSIVNISRAKQIPYHDLYREFKKYRIKLRNKRKQYKFNLNKIIKLFKKYGFLPYVSKLTGIPSNYLYSVLTKHFGMNLLELRKKLGIQKACLKTRDLKKHISRYQQIKELYDRLGTYEKVGNELNLSRERIRQILKRGSELHIFSYRTRGQAKKLNFRQLKKGLTREDLIKEIKMLCSVSKICLRFSIDKQQLNKLLEHFSIDLQEYKKAARMGRYIKEYTAIVDNLGYHPTTTELNSRREWRTIWIGITRYWGSTDNFRKEFGIEKPKMRMHPNTLKAWHAALEKRMLMKKQKKENLLQLIKDFGPMQLRDICEKLGLSSGSAYNYIHELSVQKQIIKVGCGNKVKYTINQEQILPNTTF